MDPLLEQAPQDKALLEKVLAILAIWEPYHKQWVTRANHFYALYRNYQNWKKALAGTTTDRGLDDVMRDGQGTFGPEMFVPMCYSIIETQVPAMLAQAPVMDNILPRNEASEANVANVKAMIESQHENINYELRLQTIAKDGLIYGTGVQKCHWRKDYRKSKQNMPSADPAGGMVPVELYDLVFDDPDAIAVDPKDFIVDPFSADLEYADGAFHRTWRSNRYVQRMAASKQWRNLEGIVDLGGIAETSRYDELRTEREAAVPQPARETQGASGKQPVHEVLEFHDGENVITVLDRKVVVASGPNPNWHRKLPFQIYRPTELTHEIHGIGEIEPIEQLQEELNVLRTERRYNAALVLQKVFAYHEGMVEKEDIGFGPGFLIGVNGDPREMLREIQVGDIPNSSYEEEDRITADFDRTSGISDAVSGAGLSPGDTATGTQMAFSAASQRIANKTRRLELEIINPGAQQFLLLDQQRILENRQVRIPAQPSPDQPDRRWAWLEISPVDLMGEFEVKCLSGSTQPENIPQNRADAQSAMTLFGVSQVVDQRKIVEWAARKMGVEHPETWLAPAEAKLPPQILDRLVQMGVDPQLITKALAEVGGPDLSGGNTEGQVAGDPVPPGPAAPPEEAGASESSESQK